MSGVLAFFFLELRFFFFFGFSLVCSGGGGRDVRAFNAAAGDQGKNTSAAINLKNELHREWIKNNLGEAKLAQLDAAYDRYVALMGEKDTLKKQMGDEIRSSNKAVEKKFEKEISAARFWKPVKSWQ